MDKLFESAFNYSSIGMALVGLNGRWLKVNPSLCRLLGYTESELLHIDFQTLTYPEDLDTDMTHVGNLLKGEIDSYEMEKRYIHKSGTLIWALLSVSLVRDENGMPSFFISQIQDITARKEAVLQRDTFLICHTTCWPPAAHKAICGKSILHGRLCWAGLPMS
ncbi:PAS domain S-box protein [Oxalicibacterium faecigallinarum]|uniref:histidine kinase n=1 Tax=Oxalicibacterium faecigallinarum TaxID=573741 RepID=A0A8J3APL4_9BURK|nr:PAS domain S-box protein [Oxalicibacterium faecigallinarum]GGI17590.1 hypothetical protein GCM10008066_09740 [Oxalicibacterium faecigallinarum]